MLWRLGLKELRHRLLWRDVIVEFMGTLFYIAGHTALGVTPKGRTDFHLFMVGMATALLLFVLVDSMLHLSGGFVNPIVPFSLMLSGEMSIVRALALSIAEILGSVCGSAFVYGLTPGDWRSSIGPLVLSTEVEQWRGFLLEAEQTLVLMMVAWGVLEASTMKRNGVISPGLAIGSTVGLNIMIFGRYTGGCMNPCIVFGPAVISNIWKDHWVYWTSSYTGAAVSVILYKVVYRRLLSPQSSEQQELSEEAKRIELTNNDGDIRMNLLQEQNAQNKH